MTDYLVGSTGFVGSNICKQHPFDMAVHSINVENAFGGQPDLLVYAGVPSEMFTANKNPEADREVIAKACENIRRIQPKKVVLISTVAVYPDCNGVDESTVPDSSKATPYGRNRYELEKWVEERYPSLIVRLPAIFGDGLKKNFLYDYINVVPKLLKQELFERFSRKEEILEQHYKLDSNGYFRCSPLRHSEKEELKQAFDRLGFSAVNFTDSRSRYQFYPLDRIWSDISIGMTANIKKLNLATPPVSAADVHLGLSGRTFENHCSSKPFDYDIRTRNDILFGHSDGYIMTADEELSAIRKFVTRSQNDEVTK